MFSLSILIDTTIKGTAILLLAAIVVWDLRRKSAATRHLVWTLALGGLLFLPLFSALFPKWNVHMDLSWLKPAPTVEEPPIPVARVRPMPPMPDEPESGGSFFGVYKQSKAIIVASRVNPEPVPTRPQDVLERPARPVTPAPAAVNDGTWIPTVWMCGTSLGLAWLALGFLGLVRLKRASQETREGRAYELLQSLVQQHGIRRQIRLRIGDARSMPMTWGIFRPVVLLPQGTDGWSDERLRVVLMHELGHVVRWDCLTQLIGQISRSLFWFNPLAWFVLSRQRILQEHACDDFVLTSGVPAPDYAAHLIIVTTGCSPALFTPPVALGISRSSKLQKRIETLLDATRNRRPMDLQSLVVAAVLSLCLVIPAATAEVKFAEAAVTTAPLVFQVDNVPVQPVDESLKKLAEVHRKLRELYVSPLDDKQLLDHALKGLLKGLQDPYTDYLPAEMLGQVEMHFKGGLTGIGAQLKLIDGRVTVITPLEGSPALQAGLRPGDYIQAIDGKPTNGIELHEAVKRILGSADTVVKLKVVHVDGVVQDLSVTRKQIRIRTVQGFLRGENDEWTYMLDPEHKVGYLSITQFGNPTGGELRKALENLDKQGMKALILDLRFCPGGLLSQAIETCNLFLAEGTILTTKGTGKEEQVFKVDGKAPFKDLPLIIMVNDQTASAAEIVAGSLRDHQRAILVGSRSYGKGSVQAIVKLEDGSALRMTTAYHYLPSGRNIQKRPGEKSWGVDPTDGYYIPLSAQQIEALKQDKDRRNVIGLRKDERTPPPTRLTPKMIEEKHADPQLAGALRTMVARLTGGEFIKIGKSQALLDDHLQRLEDLRQRRETLQQSLQQLDREITELQATTGSKEKKE